MQVMKCSNNNLSRPSFGLTVGFHADDMKKVGKKLPNFKLMRDAMLGINLSPEAEYMRPSTVYLKHEGERMEPVKILGIKLYNKVMDIWSAVAGQIKSEPFETPRRNPNANTIERQLSKAVRAVCDRYCPNPLEALAKDLNLEVVV
jgi:hypothetical protein